MNARSYICLDHEIEGRVYVFSIPVGATFAEAEGIALNMVDAVREMARQAVEKQAAESAPKTEVEAELVT